MLWRKKREPMSSMDRAWLLMDRPTNHMVINGVWVFDEVVDFDRLQRTLAERLCAFDRFRQRVVNVHNPLRQVYWEFDPNFDIRAHVHRIALPDPGDKQTLQSLVSDLVNLPLDHAKPLWEFYLIENYGQGSAVLGRLHHCIADGVALVRVLLSLTDSGPNESWQGEPKPERSWNPLRPLVKGSAAALNAALDLSGTLVSEGMESLVHPTHLVTRAGQGTKAAVQTAAVLRKLALMLPDEKTVFKGKLSVTKQVAWSNSLRLEDVKLVKNVMGATVNDVLVAAVTGALRRYLISRGQSPDQREIRSMVPVNVRPLDQAIEMGNRFALVYLSLPLGIADPVDRLFEVKRRMDTIKESPEAFVTYQIISGLGVTPSDLAGQIIAFFASKASAVLTNVPGPTEKRYFAGSRFDKMVFWVPQSGSIGMGISILSYGGEVTLGVLSDDNLVPDPQTIIEGFHAEFADLLRMARLPQMEDRTVAPKGASQETEIPIKQAEETTLSPQTEAVVETLLHQYDALKDQIEPERCIATTQAGTRCKNSARPGTPYCHVHQPQ